MKKIKGLSLVELMIALALGSLVTAAAVQLFLVNRQTENLQLGIGSIQDNGRFAFDFISRRLMSAGYSETGPIEPFVLDTSFYNDAIADGEYYDELVMPVVDGLNCSGTKKVTGYLQFYVNSEKNLGCLLREEDPEDDGSFKTTDFGPLISNVEAFQVLYGLDFDGADEIGYGQVDLYTNATQAKLADARIVSVRFGILLASDQPVSLSNEWAPDQFVVMDNTYTQGQGDGVGEVDFTDRRLYRTYSSTVSLRNLVEADL